MRRESSWVTLCASSMQKVASLQRSSSRMPLTISCFRKRSDQTSIQGRFKAVGAFAASVENRANSYSYDAQGRVTERHRSGGPFGDEVTITNYNDHGDKASERTTTVMNPEAGRQYEVPPFAVPIPM